MTGRLTLRCVEPVLSDMRNALLAQPTRGVHLARLRGQAHYAAFETSLDGVSCSVYVQVQALLDHWLGAATLPADQLEDALLGRIVQDCYRVQGLAAPLDGMAWHTLTGILPADGIDRLLFQVHAGDIELWLERLPRACQLPPAEPPLDLPVPLAWKLRGPALPVRELAQLAPGDAIRIANTLGYAWAGPVPVAHFCLNGGFFVIQPHSDEPSDDLAPYPGQLHDLDDLPIQVDFVLSTQSLTVWQLASLQPGCTLPLPGAVPEVTVMAGSRVLARGELVRVGDMLAVELREVTLTQAAEATEHRE